MDKNIYILWSLPQFLGTNLNLVTVQSSTELRTGSGL